MRRKDNITYKIGIKLGVEIESGYDPCVILTESENVMTLMGKVCWYLVPSKWKRLQQICDSNEKVGINNIF